MNSMNFSGSPQDSTMGNFKGLPNQENDSHAKQVKLFAACPQPTEGYKYETEGKDGPSEAAKLILHMMSCSDVMERIELFEREKKMSVRMFLTLQKVHFRSVENFSNRFRTWWGHGPSFRTDLTITNNGRPRQYIVEMFEHNLDGRQTDSEPGLYTDVRPVIHSSLSMRAKDWFARCQPFSGWD